MIHIGLHSDTEGHLNLKSKEFHAEEPENNCNFPRIEDEVVIDWKTAKEQGADPCGKCYPGKSKRNKTKKKKEKKPVLNTGFFM